LTPPSQQRLLPSKLDQEQVIRSLLPSPTLFGAELDGHSATVFGLVPSSQPKKLVSVDLRTGMSRVFLEFPRITGLIHGGSTYDPMSNQYLFQAKHKSTAGVSFLPIVNTNDGSHRFAKISRPILNPRFARDL